MGGFGYDGYDRIVQGSSLDVSWGSSPVVVVSLSVLFGGPSGPPPHSQRKGRGRTSGDQEARSLIFYGGNNTRPDHRPNPVPVGKTHTGLSLVTVTIVEMSPPN